MNTHSPFPAPWSRTGKQPRIAIIGAGMSGIAAVVKLRKAGYSDLTVFEKAARVGGTWRENTYPGLSCDVPSRWYSFSFNRKGDWKHRFSYGADIQAYMEDTANQFGVNDCVQFNTPVTAIVYEAPQWHLTTAAGDEQIFDIVISATGVLHNPVMPSIEGLDDFAGDKFHTARWDHSVDLAGKKVGIIGTGSTAAQIIGAVTEQVGEMHVFQRTPQWMAPLPQKEYSAGWKRMMETFPFLQKLAVHYYTALMLYTFAAATVGNKLMQKLISWQCRWNMHRHITDPALRAKLTPDYQAACKRLIFCSTFYPAMARGNAHLVTETIERIVPQGVQTADGQVHALDVLILATGFDPSAFILPTRVVGEQGLDLNAFWNAAPRAHRAVAMPGFPNFWMLEGPTGPVGNLSLITISEHQIDYVISMLDKMQQDGLAAIAVEPAAYEQYNAAMRERVQSTVWVTGGCTSWYMDKTGVPNLYPFFPTRYLNDMKSPLFSEYRLIENAPVEPDLQAAA